MVDVVQVTPGGGGGLYPVASVAEPARCQALMDETTARIHDIRQRPRDVRG